jgi:phosphopantothenoylcysteine decarboxylase / phosphopantothenate---cysteine ligase
MVKGKHILLGVTGGIAAYKTAWLVREFVKKGAEVQVVMTRAATQFVTPLTLSTLSHRQAIIDMFPASPEQTTDQWTKHIELGVWADVMLIAPATANTIAKITHGMADDFLTALVLALRAPLVLAPSMDVDMYLHEATQQNLALLKERGCFVIDPESGELASGLSGPGRLPEVETLVRYIDTLLEGCRADLKGKRVLITAGPTYEPIDPVRYVGNRSSGKMGFAVANAAALRGADVTLISGPVALQSPRNTRRINVQTASEMREEVLKEFPAADVLVMAAAVADFAPVASKAQKIKRESQQGETFSLELKKNPDILKALGEQKSRQILVGFALETSNGAANAQKKLHEKQIDMIVLNNPLEEGAGFGSDTNLVTIFMADGATEQLPRMSKFDVANIILDRVVGLLL